MRKPLRSRKTWLAAIVLVVTAGAGLYWFQPHKALIDVHVSEELPVVSEDGDGAAGARSLRDGEFISQEHDTTGTAALIRTADGDIVLSISGLETSNGPDLRVWLTDRTVHADEWFVFDDGYHAELGALKGNIGDQVYPVPDDVDIDKVTSVSIWCARFAVSFGAAELS